jgi:outer membrane lipoprotein-sorting protein
MTGRKKSPEASSGAHPISVRKTILLFSLLAAAATVAQTPPRSPQLEAVLTQMDMAAASFRTAQADFVWEQYQRVVDEKDVQEGVVYFRRRSAQTEMAAHISKPDRKYVLFTENRVRLYQPRIEQVTEYDVTKNREDVESFLVLGFGGRGHDLLKSFDIVLAGNETVDGVQTAKLELKPKGERARGVFHRILLWIDPARGVSLRQQFFEPSGDHRTAHYRDIKLNEKVPDDAFKLKTTSKTKTVNPN